MPALDMHSIMQLLSQYSQSSDAQPMLTTGVGRSLPVVGFSPQGDTGGGLNMPGFLADGRPANQRSESTEYARAAAQLRRPDWQPPSIIGAMINPQGASLVDAFRRNYLNQQQLTGYDYSNQPSSTTYDK